MSGRRVLLYFVAFFGFIASVNAVMVTLAIRTHSGLVTDHPYEKGLAYNKVVEAEKKQKELGWKGDINFSGGMIHFVLTDKNGKMLPIKEATAYISRPTQSGMDVEVPLKDGKAEVNLLEKGVWDVRVDAVVGDKTFQQSKRIVFE